MARKQECSFTKYVQSFSPDEEITPQTAHEIGCKFAEYFKDHEVLISTHTDAAHIHTHLIINSVGFESGKKLQMARGSIYKLRDFSDEICRQYDLSIVEPKQQGLKDIRTREYRSALKGESWKFKLMNAVDSAMAHSRNKTGFIVQMEKMGYQVKWQDSHKHITYITPDGKKCRDNKMHDDKYLKQSMEVFYEYRAIKSPKQAGEFAGRLPVTDTALRNTHRDADRASDALNRDRANADTHAGETRTVANVERHNRQAESRADENERGAYSGNRTQRGVHQAGATTTDEQSERNGGNNDYEQTDSFGAEAQGEGFVTHEAAPKVDGNRSFGLDDILLAAKHIEDLVNPYDPEKEQEKLKKRATAQKRRKKQRKSHRWEMEI